MASIVGAGRCETSSFPIAELPGALRLTCLHSTLTSSVVTGERRVDWGFRVLRSTAWDG